MRSFRSYISLAWIEQFILRKCVSFVLVVYGTIVNLAYTTEASDSERYGRQMGFDVYEREREKELVSLILLKERTAEAFHASIRKEIITFHKKRRRPTEKIKTNLKLFTCDFHFTFKEENFIVMVYSLFFRFSNSEQTWKDRK